MQAPYKEQKASNVVHLSLYFNMLSFSFTTIAFSLDKAFEWLCSTPLPLEPERRLIKGICKGEKMQRGGIFSPLLLLYIPWGFPPLKSVYG